MNKEMLTRQLLALDGIEPDGDTEIRKIRKESIHSVNSLLDSKVRDMTTDHDGSSDRMDLAELTELNTEMLNSARELPSRPMRTPPSCSSAWSGQPFASRWWLRPTSSPKTPSTGCWER